jgi:A/G-specific adenine glycosylase
MKSFSDRLLAWWDLHGRKDLPWQLPRTPYRVWVSEIMLQQTQVSTVIPYFQRFMQRFPDLPALASTSQDDVLALWAGLGYYARGRNLHKAASIIMQDFGGDLPERADQLAALPGIGESTANAIVSQAWDIPSTVVDGNVRRVLARHDEINGWAGKAPVQKILWRAAEDRLPASRGADYTQAIMDLGATLCTRSKPRCAECPVSRDCGAFLTGTVENFPARRPKLNIREKQTHMLIMGNARGQVLLEKRPPSGIWGGLWSLPEAEDESALAERFGFETSEFSRLPEVEHRLTHMRIRIKPSLIHSEPDAGRIEYQPEQRWFGTSEWSAVGLPKPVMNLLTQHQYRYDRDDEHDTHG